MDEAGPSLHQCSSTIYPSLPAKLPTPSFASSLHPLISTCTIRTPELHSASGCGGGGTVAKVVAVSDERTPIMRLASHQTPSRYASRSHAELRYLGPVVSRFS